MAMQKLSFLAGKWEGTSTVMRGPGQSLELVQTEEIEFRNNATVLVIKGSGREKATGKIVFEALGVVSWDEEKREFTIRAYSDGRKVDSVFESDGAGFAWGFDTGPVKIRHVMRLSEAGEWVEISTARLPDGREVPSVRMRLKKQ
jgi:hypothetical protein